MAAVLYRDRSGFCSGEEEEDLDTDMHSPTDASEDSVDVKVRPIANLMGGCKSKRKCIEPKKFDDDLKRRSVGFPDASDNECNPFRPWSLQTPSGFIPRGYQDEPLSLVLREKPPVVQRLAQADPPDCHTPSLSPTTHANSRPRPQDVVRLHEPTATNVSPKPNELGVQFIGHVQDVEDSNDKPPNFSVESLIGDRPGTSLSTPSTSIVGDRRKSAVVQQRNYKNMTRERRIEANARERTRVHTISAAFDTLRRAVPAYSHNQKLSKLSVLRIACSYILTLSRVAGCDYSADGSQPPLSECVDNVSRTIQLEGKLRKKKDE